MVQITADTSTMLTPRTGAELGVGIVPLHVTIAGKTYREMDEIFPPEFLRIIYEGNLPTSSQPSPAPDCSREGQRFPGRCTGWWCSRSLRKHG